MDDVLRSMTQDFLGTASHKITANKLFSGNDILFLDVRTQTETNTLSINLDLFKFIETLQIPVNEIPDNIDKLNKNKSIAIFCPGSIRASFVYTYLKAKGFEKVRVFEGGYSAILENIKLGKLLKEIKK